MSLFTNFKHTKVFMKDKYYIFIIYLRVLAVCLITLSHYKPFFSKGIFASGGILGNLLFFAISGFCIWKPQEQISIPSYCFKRVSRCYFPVWIVTVVYALLGYVSLSVTNSFFYFIYPTTFHFIGTIVVLYVFFSYFLKLSQFKVSIKDILVACLICNLLVYVLFFDKSYYHILQYGTPMVLFFFMQSMLLGAWFREQVEKQKTISESWRHFLGVVLLPGLFAMWKFCLNRYPVLSSYQILGQYILLLWVFFVFRLFSGLEKKLPTHSLILRPASFVAGLTLEIYLIQFPVISYFASHLHFPENIIFCSICIVVMAYLFHGFCSIIAKVLKTFTVIFFNKCVKAFH